MSQPPLLEALTRDLSRYEAEKQNLLASGLIGAKKPIPLLMLIMKYGPDRKSETFIK